MNDNTNRSPLTENKVRYRFGSDLARWQKGSTKAWTSSRPFVKKQLLQCRLLPCIFKRAGMRSARSAVSHESNRSDRMPRRAPALPRRRKVNSWQSRCVSVMSLISLACKRTMTPTSTSSALQAPVVSQWVFETESVVLFTCMFIVWIGTICFNIIQSFDNMIFEVQCIRLIHDIKNMIMYRWILHIALVYSQKRFYLDDTLYIMLVNCTTFFNSLVNLILPVISSKKLIIIVWLLVWMLDFWMVGHFFFAKYFYFFVCYMMYGVRIVWAQPSSGRQIA